MRTYYQVGAHYYININLTTMFECTILADSVNQFGNRITTMKVTFPRIILAEMNTHRMFSRNSASSRAIPFERMLKMVEDNPFIPIAWMKDHKGMQGTEFFEYPIDIQREQSDWLGDRDLAIIKARARSERGITKQLVNRTLEPFMWHTAIITCTEWENFFALRCPTYSLRNYPEPDGVENYYRSKKDLIKASDSSEEGMIKISDELRSDLNHIGWFKVNKGQAEIHMMRVAEMMWDAYSESKPKELREGDWHIPFGDQIQDHRLQELVTFEHEEDAIKLDTSIFKSLKIKIATARCARVSYLNYEGKDDYSADFKLHDSLSASGHWSPFEHCAKAMSTHEFETHFSGILKSSMLSSNYFPEAVSIDNISEIGGWSGNFRGFIQYRKTFKNENITIK